MGDTLQRVRELVRAGMLKKDAFLIEEYPSFTKGPCVLVRQRDKQGNAVWGIPRNELSPAVLITAYRPDPERWVDDFSRRAK